MLFIYFLFVVNTHLEVSNDILTAVLFFLKNFIWEIILKLYNGKLFFNDIDVTTFELIT